jgi:alpha/beta superfamily hydrolase
MRHERGLKVPGPVGDIDARYDDLDNATTTIVLCHPHPQYGGSMDDAVLDTMATAANRHGIAQLRFNFRGVGASAGAFDHGKGEVDDLLAVLDWLRSEIGPAAVVLAGYSFGSNIVWRALDRASDVAQILLVAPPVAMMDYVARPALTTPTAIVCGDADDFVAATDLIRWRDSSAPAATITTIAGADHFFRGTHAALREAIERELTR